MKKYAAAIKWRDLLDKAKTFPDGRVYEANEPFPATKRNVPEERIEELLGKKFIKEVEQPKE